MSRILLTGSEGGLGTSFRNAIPEWQLIAPTEAELDILDTDAVARWLDESEAATLINCAAYTAVDKAEADPATAEKVNVDGVRILAEACKARDILFVHYSTDYVFDGKGTSPYTEDRPTCPLGVYGRTKAEGEQAMFDSGVEHLLLRTAWLYTPYAPCFPRTILELAETKHRLSIVDDQMGAPTYGPDLVKATLHLLDQDSRGTFHVTNSGRCNWMEFAVQLLREANVRIPVDPISTAELNRAAPRPAYSVLSLEKIRSTGFEPRPWQESLAEFLSVIDYVPPRSQLRTDGGTEAE